MGVKDARQTLQEAAIRFTALRTPRSVLELDQAAEAYGEAKHRARVRRDKWKERKELTVGDGVTICRVDGCPRQACWRPVILFPPYDGRNEAPVRVETAMLDVCGLHARSLGPDAYTENSAVWNTICRVWTDNNMPAPDPETAEVQYIQVRPEPTA